jgi:gliding motility-associated-like protein
MKQKSLPMKKIYLAIAALVFLTAFAKAQIKAYEFKTVPLSEEIINERIQESRNKGVAEWELVNLRKALTNRMHTQQRNQNNPPPSPLACGGGCNNISFENGSSSGWTLTSGDINYTTLPCNTCATGAGALTAMTTSVNSGSTWSAGVDNCTGQPAVAPGGGVYSLCMNDMSCGGKMQEIQQAFQVTASNNVFTYQYLAVLQDGGHAATDQPYFMSQVLDGSGNAIPCTYVLQSAAAAISGWIPASGCPGTNYKGWVTVALDLTSYIGQCVTIQFLVSDCNQGGHYGYCYVDASCDQINANNTVTVCPPSAQLCGPPGFSTYTWTGPVTGNAQCLPGATAGAYTLVTTGQCPAPTRYYTVTVSPTPTVNFTSTVTPCNNTVPFTDHSTITGPATITGWSWTFGDGGTSTAQNPSHAYPGVGTYNAVLTCTSSVGCVSSFTAPVTIGTGPAAVFTNNTPCPGSPTVFNNTSTGGTAYSWDFGDGNNSTATNPSHTYAGSGSYVVTLTVTGTGTCVATVTHTVTVNPLPPVTATGNSICNGAGPVNITSGGASTYTWAPGGPGQTISVNPAATTTYVVTGTDVNGCVNTASCVVNVIANPTVSVANTSICSGQTATLTANSNTTTFAWTGSNIVAPATGSVITANPVATSTYTVVATAGTCTVSTTATVTINPNIVPTYNASSVCFGQPTVFTSTTAGVSTYTWSYGDGGGTSTIANPTNTYSAAGTYVSSYSVVNSSGCTGSATVSVIVNPPPVPAFTSSTPCQGTAVSFTNSTPATPAISTWAWGFGDGNISAAPAPTNNYAAAGIYTATLTATTTGGCTATVTGAVTVHPNPTASFSNTTVCLNTPPTTFTDLSSLVNPAGISDNITAWAWSFGDGNTSATQSPTNNYASCGTFNASLVVTTNNSCTSTFPLVVTVNCVPVLTPPASPTVCPNSPVTPGAFAVDIPGSTVNWAAGTTVTGVSASGVGTVPAYTSSSPNLTLGNISDVITAVPTSTAGCIGAPKTFTITEYPTPVMNAMPDITVCDLATVNVPVFGSAPAGSTFGWTNSNTVIGLGAAGAGNIASFPGQSGGSPTPIVGTVAVTPTLNGCVGPPSTFNITISPQPTVTLTSPPFTCPGNVVPAPTYTMNPNDPTMTFAWTNSNINTGMPANGGPAISGPFTAAANATLANVVGTVTVIPTLGTCVGPPATYTVTIYPTPVINPIPDVEYCPNVPTAPVTISMIPVSGGVQSYNWSSPTGSTIGINPTTGNTNTVPSFNTVNAGTTAVTSQIIVSGGLDGCPALPVTFNITVNPNPIAAFSFSPKVCLGNPMTFTDLSTVGSGTVTQWGWDYNNDGIFTDANTQNPQYIFPAPAGNHIVGLEVTTNKGCTAKVTEPVYVNFIPVPQFVGDVLVGCPNHPVNYTQSSTVTGPATINSWAWNFGNGTSWATDTAAKNPSTVVYTNPSPINNAFYSVSLTVTTDSGCVASLTNTNYITVYPHPLPGFGWGPQDPAPDVDNPTIYFVDESQGASGPNSYGPNGMLWYLGDIYAYNPNSNYINTVQNPIHTYEHYDPATYYVTQWVQNTYGCKDSITKPVEIRPNFTFYIPNAFSPNADGTNEGFKGTGIGIDNTTYNLWVFDRWGMMIFYTNDMEKVWDGRMQGKGTDILQEDVYVWKVRFSDFMGRKHEYKGTVSLIK